ncbi:septum site-determining protein MinC [Stella humosa]|uniref:Probable septum site-determining protein MinC n=1 Tax=Stella humosa TaxID=94 RepID=A0A3N1LMW2_9PROT|nr:septum site-determining protein MinC [Stella humosa]ROP90545.1 septum site-determining protein MinC [Stella humosa]
MAAATNQPAATELKSAPFQLRGGSAMVMVLRLIDPARADFGQQLAGKVAQAPDFYRDAPVILDLETLARWPAPPNVDFQALSAAIADAGLICVGVQNGTPHLTQAARRAGLAAFPSARPAGRTNAAALPDPPAEAARTVAPPPPPAAAAPAPAAPAPAPIIQRVVKGKTRVVTEPVRSGQQVYARDGDLIVLGTVNAGGEVLADGNVHVYGALRGKAIAGASGDREARLFCQRFDPELVSIAGLFRIADQIETDLIGQRVGVRIVDDALVFDRLS